MKETLDIALLTELFRAERWTWAKTMPGIPHEYIVRGRCRMSDAQFEQVVRWQREYGMHEVWGKYNFPYLYVDGYKYWTMGDSIPDTIILNRQKVFAEFESLAEEAHSPSADAALRERVSEVLREWYSGGDVMNIGCSDGRLLDLLPVAKERFRGCDPSRKALARFRERHPDYADGVMGRAFEECYHQWIHSGAAIVGLFGAPNYVMLPYLKMLAEQPQRPLFLMFYQEGYCPEGLESMHASVFNRESLEQLFAGCDLRTLGNYIVVQRK